MRIFFAFRKYNKFFRETCALYRRKKKSLSAAQQERIEELLKSFKKALESKDKKTILTTIPLIEQEIEKNLQKTFFEKSFDFILSISVCIIAVVIIKQMWIEHMIIPTGSMRPTFRENDMVLVPKYDFGINTVTRTGHLYFDPSLVKRGSTIVFSTENMDVPGSDYMYFYIIPGKKQYVKRIIGKPGDTLYFYGGQIYGIDAQGKEIEDFRTGPWFTEIEHIPFIQFERAISSSLSSIGLYQMNELVAKIDLYPLMGEMIDPNLKNYYELWGLENYSTARIIKKNREYLLEFVHHPSFPPQLVKDIFGNTRVSLNYEISYLPLSDQKLKKIFHHLTTSRFIVENKKAYHYSGQLTKYSPDIDVPNGTYEFINGKAYQIYPLGITKRLSKEHPLAIFSKEKTVFFYNLGIGINTHPPTNRYAYFRNQNLYLMGYPIFSKTDPELIHFLENEYQQKANYKPFEDRKPPVGENGTLDINLIKKYGMTVPPKMYFVLGDNHASSGDSRVFGFVPEANLRGSPSFVLWPPGSRFGSISQPESTSFSFPKVVVSAGGILGILLTVLYIRKRRKKITTL